MRCSPTPASSAWTPSPSCSRRRALLARPRRPRGGRVGILTNAGGAGIACADACAGAGLAVPALEPATRRRLTAIRPAAAVGNPVDLIADATERQLADATEVVADDPHVDALIVLHVPPLAARGDDPLAAVARRAAQLEFPVAAVALAQGPRPELAAAIPVFDAPETAARALGRAVQSARLRDRPTEGPHRPSGIDRLGGAAAVAEGLAAGGGWLAPELAERLGRAYGLPLVTGTIAASPTAAGRAAHDLGGPVVVKAVADGLVHKTEHGAGCGSV